MRYAADHKAQTRARVVREAAAVIRMQGPSHVGVAEVMAKVGLTHGGFYAHFNSKNDLVLEAIEQLFESSRRMFARKTDGLSPRDGLQAYVDFYLSPAHRDTRDTGCAVALIAADLPRMPDGARERFGWGVGSLAALVQGHLEMIDHPDPHAAAASSLAEMIGALAMARSMFDPAQSDEVLALSHHSVCERLHLD